jgi:hypothetical protein
MNKPTKNQRAADRLLRKYRAAKKYGRSTDSVLRKHFTKERLIAKLRREKEGGS